MPVRNQLKAACVALVFIFAFCTTIASAQNPLGLPVSPKSGSLLVGEAIHSGALQLPPSYETSFFQPALTCSPVPCVLPNVQASGGTNIANEDPIAANPKNSSQLLTGANDGRVNPYHSKKMAARMQSLSGKNPILLRLTFDGGHGMGRSTSQKVTEEADVYAFLFSQLGLQY